MATWRDWLDKWNIDISLNAGFLSLDMTPTTPDKDASWEMYTQLLTRVTTQYLEPEHGDEEAALKSVHALFDLTREILQKHGRQCKEFSKIAIVVLNQIIRPFTAKWHKKSVAGEFGDIETCKIFRSDLTALQLQLREYTKMLADMAGVEDLTGIGHT